MMQLLEDWGACYCEALQNLEVHFLDEEWEEQPNALYVNVFPYSAVRHEVPGDSLPTSHERGMI